METNPQTDLARRYVEQTGVSVFLTGKAGTGKTTFLHDIVASTTKRHAVVAPTGVAAINAGGVTIHSFFQLPFDPYLPDVKELVTEYQMPERYKALNKNKQNIIRTLELLIIDEVSMVRADLLDAIDMTLRRVRRSSRPFGGVQLLLIGDVHQLSPVVTEAERPYMERVYPSPYFFASKALQQINYVTIELTKVYRQQDAAFVDLLNHVRDNNIDSATLAALNARVGTSQKDAITLTTHNRQADAINRRHMEALHGEQRTFEAIVKGNYPDKALPCDQRLEVKMGERVMFVKNDSSGGHRYYNGMLGTVTGFLSEDDKDYIEVVSDDGDTIAVNRELWESMKYSIDAKTNDITQEVEGTFCQYPLQAAWAVTIHKAQGLTFDHVVIDAADAFAFGQVYVALSRCRTLEGLSLSTPLTAGVAFNDTSVSHFVSAQPSFEQTSVAAVDYERQYRMEKLMELFGMDDLVHLADKLYEHYSKLKNIYPDLVQAFNAKISTLLELQAVSEKFKAQLVRIDNAAQQLRAQQGAEYFQGKLAEVAALLPTIIEVDIDNKVTAERIKDNGARFAEALGLKLSCLTAVVKEGYSVQTVQRAKVDYLMNHDGKEKKTSRDRTAKTSKQSGGDSMNTDLATALRNWRSLKAAEQNVPAYVILQQKALQAIATNMPHTVAELKRQLGVGEKTVQRYGAELLDIVNDYTNDNTLTL
ncbi:MAG: AAA family ATPase [Bacteroidales bacterium]|nr:AAA family ATPase [Bacteroidales bacterium]